MSLASLAGVMGHRGRAPPRDRLPLLGIRHLRTRAYRPQTNGKAERFIRMVLSGWAYGAIYRNSHERTAALTAGSGTTTVSADTQPSATSPRSLVFTREEPTFSMEIFFVDRPLDGFCALELVEPE